MLGAESRNEVGARSPATVTNESAGKVAVVPHVSGQYVFDLFEGDFVSYMQCSLRLVRTCLEGGIGAYVAPKTAATRHLDVTDSRHVSMALKAGGWWSS